MTIKTTYSTLPDTVSACKEICDSLRQDDLELVIFFSSCAHDESQVARCMASGLEGSKIIGATTAGEIVSGEMLKSSIVAMGIGKEVVSNSCVQVVSGLREGVDPGPALEAFGDHFGAPVSELDPEKFVGIVLVDGLSGSEERLMERLGDRTDVVFIGASAGDDLKFEKTTVFSADDAHSDAAVLALLEVDAGFDVIKTQSFEDTGNKLTATSVDESSRTVKEFDGKPAAQAYADALDVPEGGIAGSFMRFPLGLMVNGEPYVRSPARVEGDGMVFFCNIKEGTELSILESTDIPRDTAAAVERKKDELGSLRGIINFHCILRTLELEQKGQTIAYGEIFSKVPTIGFSTYGEEYIGHINQTSTMLVFK